MKIRTVAIVLGDNDFGNTFVPLLGAVKLLLAHRKDLDEAALATVVRRMALPYYVGWQYGFDPALYGDGSEQEHLERTGKYLSGAKILFNEEAESDILSKDHDHGAWYLSTQDGAIQGY